MRKILKRWKNYMQIMCLSLFLVMGLSVTAFASENAPSGDALPTVSSPVNGVLRIDGIQENILFRVCKDGEVFTTWEKADDGSFLYEPLGEGEYSVEVCYGEAREEYGEASRSIPTDRIALAKWKNGKLSGWVDEPAARESGNTIDLSQAVHNEIKEEKAVTFSADASVTEYNLMLMWDAIFGMEPDCREKMLSAECRYYSLGERMDNGAHIWYKFDPAMAVTFVTSEATDCVIERWEKFDDFNMILDQVQTTGYISFEGTDVSVTVKGETTVGGLFFGDDKDTIVIKGEPADGLDTLHVEGGGIQTNGNQIMISGLAEFSSCASEFPSVYISDENGQITIRNISGDVTLSTECDASSAVTAYKSNMLIENIGGNLTVSANGGNGIEAEGDVFISNVKGTVKITSEEAHGILVGSDVRMTDVRELMVTTDAVKTEFFSTYDAICAMGDVILQNIDQFTAKGCRYGVNAEGKFSYTEEDVIYEGGGNIMISDIDQIDIKAENALTCMENMELYRIDRLSVDCSQIGIFAGNELKVADVGELSSILDDEESYGISGLMGATFRNVGKLSVAADTYGIGGHTLMLDNVNAEISGGECALIIIGDVKVTADDGVVVKSGETAAAAKEMNMTGESLSMNEVGKYLVVQSKICDRGFSCPVSRFKDMNAKKWYHSGVHYCLENGLMSGYPGGLFGPVDDTSRGMIVTILYRLEGTPETEHADKFTDVAEDAYYHDAILWAEANDIVGGYGDGRFGPDDAITREQMVAVLYRYAQYKGYDVSVGENTNILSYEDAFDISQYAIPAMQWACGADIVSGNDDHTLNPVGHAQRVHAAQMLMKFMKLH